MKKIWLGLCIACLMAGIIGAAAIVISGDPFWDDGADFLFFFVLLAAVFGYLAWLWRKRSPIKRGAEQISAIVGDIRERSKANKELSASLKLRMWSYRIVGILICAVGVRMWAYGDWSSTFWISVGTVTFIVGGAVFMLGSPNDYNAGTDAVEMVSFDRVYNMQEFLEAFKNIRTPIGSAWLGHFTGSTNDSLIFGPDLRGQYIYFYLNWTGALGYIGYSCIDNFITEQLSEPIYPPEEKLGADTAGHLCYHTDIFFFRDWLKDSIEQFKQTGTPLPFTKSEPSEIYTFTENFKLLGERFKVKDKDDNIVYEVEGTAPLINLRIFDTFGDEIFKMTKEIGHALATYQFFYKGEPYGLLEKQLTFVRDKFTMEVKDGRLEMIEYAGTVGHNFKITLNDRLIGAIMDNMDITIENVIWDNAFLVVYDKEYLPLITAMAVMVTRELARDDEGGISNRIGHVTDVI